MKFLALLADWLLDSLFFNDTLAHGLTIGHEGLWEQDKISLGKCFNKTFQIVLHLKIKEK